jgi:transposase
MAGTKDELLAVAFHAAIGVTALWCTLEKTLTPTGSFGLLGCSRRALEALRGDKTVQEIASKHKVHPNQVSSWKRQAIDGLGEVFSNGADRERQDRETEVRDLHAKIGQLTVERDFLAGGLKR